MQNVINTVKEKLNGVMLQELTDKQKIQFKNNYNCKLYNFEYGLNTDGDLVIYTNKNNYTNMVYFMGFDHAKNDYIKLKIEMEDVVTAVYDIDNERVANLAQKLGLKPKGDRR
ncbi:DUF3909 family protein [Desulfoscipio sp. XC116]|uniref:DUF3909 family protein n=1 Tax=Desulfoscipio sp. XC116 TaxID=3144975 RepID=UPI00325B36FD